MYDNLNELSEKTRQLLIDSKDNVFQAKRLISLYDVPELQFDASLPFKPDVVLRKEVFINQYHFQSFGKILDDLKKMRYFTPQGGLF
jgi:hypothetical protein